MSSIFPINGLGFGPGAYGPFFFPFLTVLRNVRVRDNRTRGRRTVRSADIVVTCS